MSSNPLALADLLAGALKEVSPESTFQVTAGDLLTLLNSHKALRAEVQQLKDAGVQQAKDTEIQPVEESPEQSAEEKFRVELTETLHNKLYNAYIRGSAEDEKYYKQMKDNAERRLGRKHNKNTDDNSLVIDDDNSLVIDDDKSAEDVVREDDASQKEVEDEGDGEEYYDYDADADDGDEEWVTADLSPPEQVNPRSARLAKLWEPFTEAANNRRSREDELQAMSYWRSTERLFAALTRPVDKGARARQYGESAKASFATCNSQAIASSTYQSNNASFNGHNSQAVVSGAYAPNNASAPGVSPASKPRSALSPKPSNALRKRSIVRGEDHLVPHLDYNPETHSPRMVCITNLPMRITYSLLSAIVRGGALQSLKIRVEASGRATARIYFLTSAAAKRYFEIAPVAVGRRQVTVELCVAPLIYRDVARAVKQVQASRVVIINSNKKRFSENSVVDVLKSIWAASRYRGPRTIENVQILDGGRKAKVTFTDIEVAINTRRDLFRSEHHYVAVFGKDECEGPVGDLTPNGSFYED